MPRLVGRVPKTPPQLDKVAALRALEQTNGADHRGLY